MLCHKQSEGIFNKQGCSGPKISRLPSVAFNDVLLIFTDVANHHKDGKSSFGLLLMMNNAPICAHAHYGVLTMGQGSLPLNRQREGTFSLY